MKEFIKDNIQFILVSPIVFVIICEYLFGIELDYNNQFFKIVFWGSVFGLFVWLMYDGIFKDLFEDPWQTLRDKWDVILPLLVLLGIFLYAFSKYGFPEFAN